MIYPIKYSFHYNLPYTITIYFHQVYINHTTHLCIYFTCNLTSNGPGFGSGLNTLEVIFHIPFDCHWSALETVLGGNLMNTRDI